MAEMTEQELYDRDIRESIADAIRAGERAHLLTVGSPEYLAVRVTVGRLDQRGRWHRFQPSVFVIWRGSRRSARELSSRSREGVWTWLAWHLPRPLAYFATIRVFAHATTGRYSDQIVPDLTFAEALRRWDG